MIDESELATVTATGCRPGRSEYVPVGVRLTGFNAETTIGTEKAVFAAGLPIVEPNTKPDGCRLMS
jgi:hypothetical protein